MAGKQRTVFLLVPARGQGKDAKTYFNRAGVAFENSDGSLNVKLDMFPNITFQIREQENTQSGGGGK